MSGKKLRGEKSEKLKAKHERRVVKSLALNAQIAEMRHGIEEMLRDGPLSGVCVGARKQARQVAMISVAQAMWCVYDQLSQIQSNEKPVRVLLEQARHEAEEIAGDLWVEGL